jgi:hypothetical protein
MDAFQIAGLCILAASLIAAALIWDWATHEPRPNAAWKWGEPPRRPRRRALAEGVMIQFGYAGLTLTSAALALRWAGAL